MKREIKFRAFQDNQMLASPISSNYGLQRFFGMLYEDAPIMQFTGLQDKNNKDIYESDIVKYYQPYANKWEIHIVKWDDLSACFGLFEEGNKWCKESDWVKIKDIEVLGNIYENPELLQDDN